MLDTNIWLLWQKLCWFKIFLDDRTASLMLSSQALHKKMDIVSYLRAKVGW